MVLAEGKNWINKLTKDWKRIYILRNIILSIAATIFLCVAAYTFLNLNFWSALAVLPLCILVSFKLGPIQKITPLEITRVANEQFPELEESADLFLKNNGELSLLEGFQLQKINAKISQLAKPQLPFKKIYNSLVILIVAMAISIGLYYIPKTINSTSQQATTILNDSTSKQEVIPPGILSLSTKITPPAYTKKPIKTQKQFALVVETGAQVNWNLVTKGDVKGLAIIFNDKEKVSLKPENTDQWSFSKIIKEPGFYQLEINGIKSDLYQIDLIPDLPVNIKIKEPSQHHTIDIGHEPKVKLQVDLNDDYGIKNAFISATMASGKGEGVSFTEKKLTFNASFNSEKQKNLSKILDLTALGMKPGDELYFFVGATDNNGQNSQSDVHFVSIADTTELMSLDGMTSGVNLVPEYFRSQRQIIIDIEKLLKEQPSITSDLFKSKSNDIGVDQKLLRLKYGQFLGEENETQIGGDGHDDHDDHDDHGAVEVTEFGNAEKILDQIAHKHDTAEDATFFEPEVKAQLKNVLNEMWNSELKLRTYTPKDALPYAYKALRLLKDLQQKSRAFVAKTTIKKPNFKPEKRLSGELNKIVESKTNSNFDGNDERLDHLKKAISILDQRKQGKKFNDSDLYILSQVEKYMILEASKHPSIFLKALTSLRKITSTNKINSNDIIIAQFAIDKLIVGDLNLPQPKNQLPASQLYKNYFKQLTR